MYNRKERGCLTIMLGGLFCGIKKLHPELSGCNGSWWAVRRLWVLTQQAGTPAHPDMRLPQPCGDHTPVEQQP